MSSLEITCPHCEGTFELTEALAGPMLEAERRKAVAAAERKFETERKALEAAAVAKVREENAARIAELEQANAAKDAQVERARQAEVAAIQAQQAADAAKRNADLEVARRVQEQTAAAANLARIEAAKQYAAELEAAKVESVEKDAKLAVAQQAEIDARRATREAEEAKREALLLVERKLDEERGRVREQALKERDEEYRLKVAEKDKQLADLKEKLDEAQRKADLGSQQLKGDVLELDLHGVLSNAFPGDDFERIKKGQKGGDVIHTVRSSSGLVCGRIKWESKHTQNWIPAWLPKLRDDQRNHKCDLAALMTETLPDGVTHFDVIDDVWVSGIATVLPMAAALRRGLIDTATARRAAAGSDSKKDIVYTYLTGPEFRARVRGIVEPVVEMRTTLDAEKRSASRQFALREKQLERMGLSLSGMYGDLQGLVGPSLPTVEGLALPEPEAEESGEAPQLTADAPAGASGEVH